MKISLFVLLTIAFMLGCARVRVEAPKEPIKVDISMRLDIYQHVAKDIDNIENIVSGQPMPAQPKKADRQSGLNYFVGKAFAQEQALSPDVEQAALRRKNRKQELGAWEQKGVIGENSSGLLEIRAQADPSVKSLVDAENNDRMVIYQGIAQKNGTSVSDVQKLYAKRLQNDAPAGTPIEVNAGDWKIK